MIIKIKNVYYCEYCKKHSLMPLLIHEKHCTKNPDRECRLCGRKESLKDLIKKYKLQCKCKIVENELWDDADIINQPTIKDINEEVGYCPICILSIIRQYIEYPFHIDFDYKKELKLWWEEENQSNDNSY